MGLNKRRHKFMKLRRTMKAQSPKKKRKKKEIIKKKEEDLSQRTCSKDLRQDQKTCTKDLGQARRHAVRISARPEDMQQEESTSRPYVCSDFQQKRPLKIQHNPVKELGWDT